MSQNTVQLLLFALQLVVLYFLSRQTIKQLFIFFRRFFPERMVLIIITIIFLPGTIMHELAHFLMAIMLMLRVREVSILPEFQKDSIKLGKVIYEKRDIVRGILVGIAPIFAGMLLFWFFSIWDLFPASNVWITILLGYLIFVISTTMFSSKQDLVDLIYIIPIGIILAGAIYVFNINVAGVFRDNFFWTRLRDFIVELNYYFLFSFLLHVGIIGVLKGFQRLYK